MLTFVTYPLDLDLKQLERIFRGEVIVLKKENIAKGELFVMKKSRANKLNKAKRARTGTRFNLEKCEILKNKIFDDFFLKNLF